MINQLVYSLCFELSVTVTGRPHGCADHQLNTKGHWQKCCGLSFFKGLFMVETTGTMSRWNRRPSGMVLRNDWWPLTKKLRPDLRARFINSLKQMHKLSTDICKATTASENGGATAANATIGADKGTKVFQQRFFGSVVNPNQGLHH